MSSAEIYAQIQFYEALKSTIGGLFGYFDNCIDVANEALKFNAYELVINGKPLIEGDVTMKDVYNELSNDRAILGEIINECNRIIEELWVAYYAALEAEKETENEA